MLGRLMPSDSEITELLHSWSRGDSHALGRLVVLVFDELHRMAARYLHHEAKHHSLQPTALINQVYIELFGTKTSGWNSRKQFFAFASKLMRHLLINHARAKQATKRGGETVQIPLDAVLSAGTSPNLDILALDLALQELKTIAPRQAEIVEMRFFTGLTVTETADVLDLSPATVKREWSAAKFWLRAALSDSPAKK